VLWHMPVGTRLLRIFFQQGMGASHWHDFRHYGPLESRFDHHELDGLGKAHSQARGILYACTGPEAVPTCLAVVFQGTGVIERSRNDPALVSFVLAHSLVLLDLTGYFTTTIGASMAINTGSRRRSRRWAQQLYDAYPQIHGIRYSSSKYGNQPAVALFGRAMPAMPKSPEMLQPLNDIALFPFLQKTAAHIGYTLV